jgi:ferritin-like metal-binding protein YciE
MSDLEMNEDSSTSDSPEASEGADLASALGGGEVAFITGAETKKPINRTLLVIVGAALLGGGALFFNHARQGPASASAGTTSVMSTADAKKRISQFLDNGKGNVKVMEQMLHNTEKVVQQFQNYPSVTQVPLGELKTNPFKQSSTAAKDDATDPDLKKKLEAQRQTALKNVQNLQLQSVMKGDQRSTCMINNTLFREGQSVEDFFIEKINTNSVIVRSNEFRFELKMQK